MFVRISKLEARKLFTEGNKGIYLCPCKFYPSTPFNMACLIFGQQYLESAQWYHDRYADPTNGTTTLVKNTVEETAWDLMYNNWAYYNTSYETGYYAHYYIER